MTTPESHQLSVTRLFRSKVSRLSSKLLSLYFVSLLLLLSSALAAQVQVITFDDEYQNRWLPEGEERVAYTQVGINIESGATSTNAADYVIEWILPEGMEVTLVLSDPPLVSRECLITGTPETGTAGNWNVKIKVSEYTDASHTVLRAQGTFRTVLEIIEGEHWGPFTFSGEPVMSRELEPGFINRSYQSTSVYFEFNGESSPTEFEVEALELDTLGLDVVVERNDDTGENWFSVSGLVLPDVEDSYQFVFRVSPANSNAWGQVTLKLEILDEPAPISVSRTLQEGFNKHDGRLMTALLYTPYDSNDSFWPGHGLLVKNSMGYTVEVEGLPAGLELVATDPVYGGQGVGIQSKLSLAGIPTETGIFDMVVAVTDQETGESDEMDVSILVERNPSSGDMLFGGPSVGAMKFPAARVAESYPPVTDDGNPHLPQRELDIDTACYLRVYWADEPDEEVPVAECTIAHNMPTGMTVAAHPLGDHVNVLRVAGDVASNVAGDYNPRIKLEHAASGRSATLSLPLHVVSRAKILTSSLESQKEGEERTTYIQYETIDNDYIDLDEEGVVLTGLPEGLEWSVNKYNYRIVIDGTPAEGSALDSPYSVYVKLTFDDGSIVAIAEETFALHIEEAEIVISLDASQGFREGISIEPIPVGLSDGFEPYSLEASGLPPGLVLEGSSDDGFEITGTPDLGSARDSPFILLLNAEDTYHHTGHLEVRVVVAEPNLLPTVILGEDYFHQLTPPSWGTPPYTSSLEGRLPPGLEMNEQWLITGVPNEHGEALQPSYFAVLTIEDSTGQKQTLGLFFTLRFRDLLLNMTSLNVAYVGRDYLMPLAIEGGYGDYVVRAENLPAGLSVAFNDTTHVHEIVGTPSIESAGSYFVRFEIYDSAEFPDTYFTQFSLSVYSDEEESLIHILTTSLPSAVEGQAYGPVMLEAEGASFGVYDWSQSTGLPPGLNLRRASNGGWFLEGTPLYGTANDYFAYLIVADEGLSVPRTATRILPVTVFPASSSSEQTPPLTANEVFSSLLATGAAGGCSMAQTRTPAPAFWIVALIAGVVGLRCLIFLRERAETVSMKNL